MTTWTQIAAQIKQSGAKNIRVHQDRLFGNDGTVLTFNPNIARDYVATDWDAINCQPSR